MAFVPLFDPTQQFMGRSSKLLVGGNLYVYRNGTDDLATVKNIAGTTISQPVVLDCDGRAQGGVCVSSGGKYRLEVKDAYGALQWSITGMSAIGGGDSPSPVPSNVLWGHWISETGWQTIDDSPYFVLHEFEKAEGNIGGTPAPGFVDIVLPKGLYNYSLELAFNSSNEGDWVKYDLKIMYGERELRAMSFTFLNVVNNVLFTEWASGLFEMEEDGKIEFRVSKSGGDPVACQLKLSHFFANTIG